MKEGDGVATYVNDDTIEGKFVAGQPHGVLLYRFANGTKKYATYVQNPSPLCLTPIGQRNVTPAVFPNSY